MKGGREVCQAACEAVEYCLRKNEVKFSLHQTLLFFYSKGKKMADGSVVHTKNWTQPLRRILQNR